MDTDEMKWSMFLEVVHLHHVLLLETTLHVDDAHV